MKNLNYYAGTHFLALVVFTIFFFFLVGIEKVFSQDLILKNDKTEIKAKVLGIQGDFVRYTLFNSSDDRIRNIPVSEVFMIIYENGTREVFDVSQVEKSLTPSVPGPRVVEEQSPEGFIMGGKGNYYLPWNEGIKELYGSGFMLGIFCGYRGIKSGVDFDLRYYSKSTVFSGMDTKFSLMPITVTGFWNIYKQGNLETYIGGGLGVCFITLTASDNSDSEKLNSTGFELHSTGGIRFKPFYFEISFSSIFAEDYEDADLGGVILGFGFFF